MKELAEGDTFYLPFDTELYKVMRVETNTYGDTVYVLRGTYDGGSFRADHFTLETMQIERT